MALPKEIFLSYGREAEVVEFVKKLKSDLEADGFGVWLDQNDIPAGCDWHAAIGSGLDQCHALLAVVTPKYVTSRYCTSELYTADGDQKIIFPVFYAETDLSSSERARGVKYVISGINWTMFRPNVDDYDISLEKLKFGLRQRGLGGGPHQAEASAAQTTDNTDLTAAVENLTLSPTPQTPTSVGQTAQPSAPQDPTPVPPYSNGSSAPVGYETVDGSGLPTYESSLLFASTTPSQQSYQHQQGPGHSPWQVSPGQGGPYPPQGHPYPDTSRMPYPQVPGQYPPMPGQTSPYGYGQHMHSPYPVPGGAPYHTPTHPAHQPAHFSGGMESSPYRSPAPAPMTMFAVGQRLEALDRATSKICVATIQEMNAQGQVLIHFDNCSSTSDYWCESSSHELHPVGWSASCRVELQPPNGIPQTEFNWFQYLNVMQAQAAPHHLFSEAQRSITQTQPPTPSQSTLTTPKSGPQPAASSSSALPALPMFFPSSSAKFFAPQMALEVDDPDSPTLTYICSVLEVKADMSEIRLHYEGWGSQWDFWTSSTNSILHPPGWCASVGRTLKTPTNQTFTNWQSYINERGFTAAPDYLFNEEQRKAPAHRPLGASSAPRPELRNVGVSICGFLSGMAVEVDDPNVQTSTYLCSIVDVDAETKRLLVHYEGWTSNWDFWLGVRATSMHYMGWCADNGRNLRIPAGSSNWTQYITESNLTATTKDMFTYVRRDVGATAEPTSRFGKGLALEIADPNSSQSIYLATVVDVNPTVNQIKVSYVGWQSHWDFWVDSLTSTGIHPIGWGAAHSNTQHLPNNGRNMSAYLESLGVTPAPLQLFTPEQKAGMAVPAPATCSVAGLCVGMRLEAVDRKNRSMTCAANIVAVNANNDTIQINFDGWTDTYNYWCSPHDPDIHPIGWCRANHVAFHAPLDIPFSSWQAYLDAHDYLAMPREAFCSRQCSGMGSANTPSHSSTPAVPNPGFAVGMRLEAKDRANPSLVCVASVKSIDEAAGRMEIFFDGWSDAYNYWCSYDDVDIHPMGWCAANQHGLQSPHGLSFGSWANYLNANHYTAAPFSAFKPQQTTNMRDTLRFTVGMKLEARDRINPSLVCVATVAQVDGNRILIHFDGWTSKYDYWCTRETEDIHPVGWCQRTGNTLQAPKGQSNESFQWHTYLRQQDASAAPQSLFLPPASTHVGCFMIGMKMEAVDRRHPSLICVATIKKLWEGKLTVHFDGWDESYDYQCQRSSPDLHPVGWCARSGRKLQPPKGYEGVFIWTDYLQHQNARAIPDHLFTEEQRRVDNVPFEVNMKLEAKDRLHPSMTAVATIQQIRDNGRELLIHFDGWTSKYDYWCDRTTADIHPVGWCAMFGNKLHAPKGMNSAMFQWKVYLKQCDDRAAPEECFSAASLQAPH